MESRGCIDDSRSFGLLHSWENHERQKTMTQKVDLMSELELVFSLDEVQSSTSKTSIIEKVIKSSS